MVAFRKEDLMAEIIWTIEGKRFRNEEEYMAAKRDKQLIDSIISNLKLDNPKDVEKIYLELKRGKYQFESIVGRQFDDNIYELYRRMKKEAQLAEEQKSIQTEKRQRKKENKQLTRMNGKASYSKAPNEKIKLEDFDESMQKEILQVLRKKERKRRLVMITSFILCTICFGYAAFYYQASAKSAKEFEELLALKEAGATQTSDIKVEKQVKINLTNDEIEIPDILPEYEAIYNKNQKLIGWIKIEDTIIDYPVMQTVNNEYYLDHNFNQESDNNGCIFMDYQCDAIRGNDNTILYGHHMKSGKMFGTLNKYSKQAYYEEHPIIQFDTIYEKGEYQVMYVFRSKVYSEEEVNFKYYQFFDASSEKEYNSYLNEMAELSLYDTGVTASYGDKLLTLSTCDYQTDKGRFVVVAKKVG